VLGADTKLGRPAADSSPMTLALSIRCVIVLANNRRSTWSAARPRRLPHVFSTAGFAVARARSVSPWYWRWPKYSTIRWLWAAAT